MKIDYIGSGYPEKRNFLDAEKEIDDLKYIKSYDLLRGLAFIYFKVFKKVNYSLDNLHFSFKNKNVTHFFNNVSLSNKYWVSTFESAIPRSIKYKWLELLCVKKIASSNCKKIIAMSNCTFKIQSDFLQKRYPQYHDQIIQKCQVIHPPQKLIVKSYEEKRRLLNDDVCVFTFIGADFFRKGGNEILNAFKNLRDVGIFNWELNIVSSLKYGDYATQTTEEDYKKVLTFINSFDTINHFNSLDNDKVISLLKNSHVGLLPTWADTYGYSVLEAQACATPVVSTNVRALPEINNENCGWVLNVPKSNSGELDVHTKIERDSFSIDLTKKLTIVLKDIMKNSHQISEKGQNCISRISTQHDPKKFAEKLKSLYEIIKD